MLPYIHLCSRDRDMETVKNKFNINPLHSSDVMHHKRYYEYTKAVPSEQKINPKFEFVYFITRI
jgi:hypothetical protein